MNPRACYLKNARQAREALMTLPNVQGVATHSFPLTHKVVGDDGFITTVTTVTQQRESPDNSDLQELLDKLAQEKH
uniref:Uncharacterized protein n=1 Tax=Timema poppense TaxID=170557 RepID=A0A7R9CNS2_TIMPO|nr:unnamed protein product [Timema poppensis]